MLRKLPSFYRSTQSSVAAILMSISPIVAAETFRLDDFHNITFDKIPSTKYSEKEGVMTAEVASSSSFLLKPFTSIKLVKKIQWRWKVVGDLKVGSYDELRTKIGDDAILRIGLIKSGDAPMVPFFAPAWVNAIQSHMKLPGTEMQYLVVGGPAPSGATWVSPYTSSMSLRQVQSTTDSDGWNLAQQSFSEPMKVVGLWLMSDGDGTKSTFVVSLKDLELLE